MITMVRPAAGLLAASKKFWILDPLYAALGVVLAGFYAVIPSYGVAIILLTITVSILRMPLVAKQVKSQQEMQRIQPELKRIQAKYKADPQKRNEELMKLYKEHSVNPFAGCLPLLLQMPLFIVLYRLILNLNHRPAPKNIPKTSRLYHDLIRSGGKMREFGMDLAQRASAVHGFGKLFPYAILIVLVIMTGLYQQRQMTSRMPKDAMTGQMAVMGKIFPLFLGFISFNIPAGVVLYFIVSNLWQIGQQSVLFRHQQAGGAGAGGGGGAKAGAGGGGSGSGGSGSGGSGSGGSGGGGSGSGGDGQDGKRPASDKEKSSPGAGGRSGGFFARLARAANDPRDASGDGKADGKGAAAGKGGARTTGKAPRRSGSTGGSKGDGSRSSRSRGSGSGSRGKGQGGTGGQTGGGRSGSNGRGPRGGTGGNSGGGGGGRAQGKGQGPGGSRPKPRNTRRGK